ncbi:hypothetical protein KOW79_015799 [Hemibagrus wyckioides]|uniref:Uncharacterized protein n=1 Tax=Hemibagrus wyckioides TaxID=337641 RepID=A0A9D3NFC4_9TELE|nr:hypothetical protein KOW79_015799 [Hemibagrus wyckioides]
MTCQLDKLSLQFSVLQKKVCYGQKRFSGGVFSTVLDCSGFPTKTKISTLKTDSHPICEKAVADLLV